MSLKRISLALLVVIALAWMASRGCAFLAVDRCLDGGGRWNYQRGVCEGME